MKQSKIGIIFLTTILALAGISASYAGFMDTIYITGTATTGSVNLDLESVQGTWVWKNITDHQRIINFGLASSEDIAGDEEPGDDVLATEKTPESWYVNPNMLLYSYVTAYNDTENDDHIFLRFDNLTPEVDYKIMLKLQYLGKTPARILKDGLIFDIDQNGDKIDTNDDGTKDTLWLRWLLDTDKFNYSFVFAGENGEPSAAVVDPCAQLHYSDSIYLIIKIKIPQIQILQGLQGNLGFTINLIQFDEAEDCDTVLTEATIGDYVWYDSNKNGLQDPSELGVTGVTVNLYTSTDTLVETMTTDGDGNYLFFVQPGSYYVEFILPDDYDGFTLRDQGINNGIDSDADQTTGKTIVTTLVDEQIDLTWDAGLIKDTVMDESCISIVKTINGSFTDPETGEDLTEPTDQIAIGADFPTKFEMKLCVQNCGTIDLSGIQVVDYLGPKLNVSEDFSNSDVQYNSVTRKITWTISSPNPFHPGDVACMTIPLETIRCNDCVDEFYPVGGRCLVAISPEDGSTYVSPNGFSYHVENPTNNPFYCIKFETIGEGVKPGQDYDYDIFEFTLSEDPGIYEIDVSAKGGTIVGTMVVEEPGDTFTDNGFTVEFMSKTTNLDGTVSFVFKVTNSNNRALSHVAFRLPCIDGIGELLVNPGAKVTVSSAGCIDILEAMTDPVTLNICCVDDGIGTITTELPFETDIATDTCTPSD